MRKKKITETVPADPLDDLPVKLVSDEDPEDHEDGDSEEADEIQEPDEGKYESSGQDDSTPHRGGQSKRAESSQRRP
jgi:hypothetical protein